MTRFQGTRLSPRQSGEPILAAVWSAIAATLMPKTVIGERQLQPGWPRAKRG
jgi:hypothetical protein